MNAPRELIHLFQEVRNEQLKRFETRTASEVDESIFEQAPFKSAIKIVSDMRLKATIFAEYPDVRPWLEALRLEKATQHIESLMSIWSVDRVEAENRIQRLLDVGVLSNESNAPIRTAELNFPFLYRPSLGLIQGRAPK
ncbi:hypothetical protein [Timonella senegalensis]|uniref:hypothetical protein n=1 Tax=Timonella senegalensis TaxID=1465825 RepID=UPI002FDDE1B9